MRKRNRIERWSSFGGLVFLACCMIGILILIQTVASHHWIGWLAYLALVPWLALLLMLAPTAVECWEGFRGRE